jgi:hypothetical protein
MSSPLKYDANIKEEFGIKSSLDLDDQLKLGFVRSQFDELKKMLWRTRVELQLAEAQTKTEVEAMAADARNKIAAHRNDIKGYVRGLNVLQGFIDELDTSNRTSK